MKNVYTVITETIIEELEKGVIPWRCPWSVGRQGCYSYSTEKPYSLLNTLLLGGVSGDYVTFKGAQKAGGNVRKGEKSKMIVFWHEIEKEDEDGVKERIPVLQSYHVFHTSQCDGLKPKHDTEAQLFDTEPIEYAEEIIKEYANREGIRVVSGNYDEAFYDIDNDLIQLPGLERYSDASKYYSTAFHELAHSTGNKKRLNRLNKHSQAHEELVAELASAFIMNTCGLDTLETFENSEGYIQGWLKALRNDKRLIIKAAGEAEKAVSRILGREDGE